MKRDTKHDSEKQVPFSSSFNFVFQVMKMKNYQVFPRSNSTVTVSFIRRKKSCKHLLDEVDILNVYLLLLCAYKICCFFFHSIFFYVINLELFDKKRGVTFFLPESETLSCSPIRIFTSLFLSL